MSPFRLQQKTVEHIRKVETSCYFDKKKIHVKGVLKISWVTSLRMDTTLVSLATDFISFKLVYFMKV